MTTRGRPETDHAGATGASAAGGDQVDTFIAQWAKERPELDVSPMAIIGRISRLALELQQRLDAVFAQFGLQSWEFDVMATLIRSGEPHELTPGELDRTMMITSGTTTHRISKLEQRGFVTRTRDQDDRRVVRVRLTESGRAVFDAAHVAHMANEQEILAPLVAADRAKLLDGLRALSGVLAKAPPS
ncbi:MarR family winged helix-turn-helix transcriptional regulator [Demequina aurantiaca]|uniref:MarR family winged helix-turn-helix transcriptional regulator n=1 Tax=Demequina aurantiaca TaxID=676200 RepID=UPI003D3456C7